MRSQLNRFLLILMMLALPVQAFASAAMLDCAFSHQGQTKDRASAKQGVPDGTMATCHEQQTDQSPAPHQCKHCTACYLSSALLVASIDATPSILPATHSVIPHADDTFIGFIPDSPERPPRVFFA